MSKSIIGEVSSVAGNKTIVIITHWRKTHPIYKKQYKVSAKYMAHDEKNDCRVGDKVVIVESRPISARKRYVLKEILQRAELTEADKAIFKKEEVNKKEKLADKPESVKPETTEPEPKKPIAKAKPKTATVKKKPAKEAIK